MEDNYKLNVLNMKTIAEVGDVCEMCGSCFTNITKGISECYSNSSVKCIGKFTVLSGELILDIYTKIIYPSFGFKLTTYVK